MFYEEPKMELIYFEARNVFTIRSEESGDYETGGDWENQRGSVK